MDTISNLIRLLSGPAFWLVVIWVMWTGYEIGKEATTNWFNKNSQQKSSMTITQIWENSSDQIDSKVD
ncbi:MULTISPECIES: hypothetical protein [unclassified Anabaena]|uniref:hypothetical protein n=1 Tax=unclassified Anabaena TaxID=2619674 RepID=UPI00083284E1|nr:MULTISPECIES: hypothetical protein [unclassified Anabaena]